MHNKDDYVCNNDHAWLLLSKRTEISVVCSLACLAHDVQEFAPLCRWKLIFSTKYQLETVGKQLR